MAGRTSHPRVPSYRLHRPTGQAVVTIDGRDHYLGRHGTQESRAEYDRRIAEWLGAGRTPPGRSAAGSASDTTVAEVILAYLRFADAYDLKDGRPTKEPGRIRLAMRPLRKLYGGTPAAEFGPLRLKAVRQAMIDAKLSRTGINGRVAKIVRAFKWAVENELVPAGAYHGLRAVSGLRKGPVRGPGDRARASGGRGARRRDQVLRLPQVWAMIRLQSLAALRSGEVVTMRTRDLDTSGATWTYRPASHKTEHHDKERLIPLGPQAQAVLKEWLRPDEPDRFLFSPAAASAEQKAARRAARKTKVQPSQIDRRRAKPKKLPGERYTANSYRHAIQAACDRVGIPRWFPHQLRHLAATRLRKQFGLEAARIILGHSSVATTTIYAEMDGTRAAEIMTQVG